MTTLQGQIDSTTTLAELRAEFKSTGLECLLCDASEGVDIERLCLSKGEAALILERVSSTEVVVHGETGGHAALRALAWATSRVLSAAEQRHRLEVLGQDERVLAYFHWQWPTQRLWIGHVEADTALAQAIADVARAGGAAVTIGSCERLPVADPLAALMATVGANHDTVIWLLREDEGREVWVAREAAVMGLRDDRRAVIYRIVDDELRRGDGEALTSTGDCAAPLAVLRDAFPRVNLAHRRLIIVEDAFRIGERMLVLAPDLPLYQFPGGAQKALRVGIGSPRGEARCFDAVAEIPLVSPTRSDKPVAYVLTLPGLSKGDVPLGSEVWLESGG